MLLLLMLAGMLVECSRLGTVSNWKTKRQPKPRFSIRFRSANSVNNLDQLVRFVADRPLGLEVYVKWT